MNLSEDVAHIRGIIKNLESMPLRGGITSVGSVISILGQLYLKKCKLKDNLLIQ